MKKVSEKEITAVAGNIRGRARDEMRKFLNGFANAAERRRWYKWSGLDVPVVH